MVDEGILGCGVVEVPAVESGGVPAGRWRPACNPSTPADRQWPALWAGWLERYHPAVVAVLAGRWEVSTWTGRAGGPTSRSRPSAAYVERQLQRAVDVAARAGPTSCCSPPPATTAGSSPTATRGRPTSRTAWPPTTASCGRWWRPTPHTATLVDLDRLVCPGGRYESAIDGVTVRAPDGVHFPFEITLANPQVADPDTLAQVERFGGWIAPRLWPRILDAG